MRKESDLLASGPEVIHSLHQRVPEPPPFLDKIKGQFHGVDLVLLTLVPLILIAIAQLPIETRMEYAFEYSSPSLLTAFTANYVHLTWPHLLSNIASYTILIIIGYLLALSNGNRKRFYGLFGLVVFILPIPISYLNLVFPRPGIALGFSGLNMAFFGFVLVEFAAFVGQYFTDNFDVENAPAFFFIVTAFVAATHATTIWGAGVLIVSFGLALLYSIGFLLAYRPSVEGVKTSIDKQGYFELLLITALVLVAFVPIAFPRNPVTDSGTVNLYIHLIGLCIGYMTVYTWVLTAVSEDPERAILIES